MLAHHPEHRIPVGREAFERAHHLGDPRACAIRLPGHQRGDRACPRATPVGVVGKAAGHEQSAQVRVPESELPVGPGIAPDLLRRVVRLPHDDLLRGEDDLDGVAERCDVEVALVVGELQQVQRCEVARGVVEVHVLGARVRRVDPTRRRARVPFVDRGVVLHAGVRTLPRRLSELAHQLARPHRLNGLVAEDGLEPPVLILLERLHELVRHAHGVVRVLILDRERVPAVQVHVEPGVAHHARLPLLVRLAPDEVADIGMIDVQDHHLRGASGLAARLDRAGAGVGAAHEAHRTGGGSAAGERLARGPDLRQVDARARSALEDRPLLDVPVQDRGHRVVDGEDEACRALLRRVGHADVEPHRRVERGLLGHDQMAELVGEDLRIVLGGEVAVLLTPPADRVDHAARQLSDRRFALGGVEGAAEVLLRDDVGRVLGPVLRELDVALLEGVAALLVVRDHRVSRLPLDVLERVPPLGREEPREGETFPDHLDIAVLDRHLRALLSPVGKPYSCRITSESQGCDSCPHATGCQASVSKIWGKVPTLSHYM